MRFFIKFLTILFVFMVPNAFADTLWPDRNHPAVSHAALEAGSSYLYYIPSGFSGLKSDAQNIMVFTAELYAPLNTPIFSRLRWMSTQEIDFGRQNALAGDHGTMVYSFTGELKTPFDISFFGHKTPIYLQYSRSSYSFPALITQDINYKGSATFPADSYVTMGDLTEHFALALNTPITFEDAPYSYSRFGAYYSSTRRGLSATLPGSTENWLFDVIEWSGGLFYDLSKPVWVKGLILGIYLSGGVGVRDLGANTAGITDGNFEGAKLNMFLNFEGRASYRIDFTDFLALRILAQYRYGSLTTLQRNSSESGEYHGSETSHFFAGGVLSASF